MLSSGLPPSIASVQPYDGQQLTQSPQEISITFNGLNVPALMGNFDVQIEKLNADGTQTPLWNEFDSAARRVDDGWKRAGRSTAAVRY